MNEKPVQAWIIFLLDGSIDSAHCTCMAGLGEVCTHTAAACFALHFHNSLEEASCTENLCLWNVPKQSKKIEFKKIKDIIWGKITKPYKNKSKKNIKSLNLKYLLII